MTGARPTAVFPHRHVPIEGPGAARMAGALELAAPLALGQRGLVVAPPGSGATTVLQWLGAAVVRSVPSAEVRVVLVDRPVEELIDWREAIPTAELFGTTSEASGPEEHAALDRPFIEAAAQSRLGRDVVLLVDSLAAFARALAATRGIDDPRVLDGGIPQVAVRELRSLFGLARATPGVDGGSLTIIATVQVETAQQLDDVVLHELVGTGNVEWRLDADAFRAGAFPPVDIIASGARHAELIVGDADADRRGALRARLDAHGPLGGLALLLQELDELGSLERVLTESSFSSGAGDEQPPTWPG
ncbi:MAG: putative transcription termination factor [Thermoleophilia bacterium]|nr:putative transcription termination factor [Thermoleophilia bacterium]